MFFFSPFSIKSKFIYHMRQTWILVIISIFFVIGHKNHFSSLGYMMLLLWFGRKALLSTILHIIKVHLLIEKNLDSHNNLHFLWLRTTIMFSSLRHMILMLWFSLKSFLFHHIPYNQSLSIKWVSNLFVIGHYNHVLLIGICDIDAFVWQAKVFFPPSF